MQIRKGPGGSPTGNRARDGGRDLSEGSELAKKENHHILYLVDRWLTARGCVVKRGLRDPDDPFALRPWATERVQAPRYGGCVKYAQFARGESSRVSLATDGAEILNQLRRFSMPRASVAEIGPDPRASQALDRCSFDRATDAGQRRRRQILRSPLFTPVYGCSRHSVGVPSSPTERTATGATSRSHVFGKSSRSGRDTKIYGD